MIKLRCSSIDIARGITVTLMIMADLPTIIPMRITQFVPGQLAAPVFIVIAGLSYELFISSRQKRGLGSKEISLEVFLRAILLLTIVMIPLYFGSLFYPDKFQFEFNWGVFQIIGAGYLFSIILKRNLKLEILSIFLLFLFTYILKTYFLDWSKFLLMGLDPIFPCLAYFILGRVISEIYMSENMLFKGRILYIIAGIALFLTVLMFKLDFIHLNRWDYKFFILLCSIVSLTIILLNIVIDKRKIKIPFIENLERVGKIAFSSYYIIYGIELVIFPYLNSHFLTNLATFTLVAIYVCSYILIVLLLSFGERIWFKYNYAFGVEWLLRSGVQGIMKLLKRSSAVQTRLRDTR